MKINEKTVDSVLVLALEGEIMGGDETRPLQDRVYRAIREGRTFVVLDMKEVSWINSSGLGALMACLTTLRGSGGDLRLAGVSDRVRRPITITRLDQVLMMFESVEEALKGFGEGA
ncbi:MAG: STAS domain-containing protein [bacterium]|nr:STAS domain-containing protein [bacterium]